jgi:hypothetical protein
MIRLKNEFDFPAAPREFFIFLRRENPPPAFSLTAFSISLKRNPRF